MSRIEEALKKVANRRNSVKTDVPVSVEIEVDDTPPVITQKGKERINELLDVPPIIIDNLMLATTREEKTVVAEEYNKLRSAVIALTKGDDFLNTLMITSTASEEGKSMTALNLAISLAKEYDHTVLLVDTDLRRPSIHKFLGIQPEVGLTHCLRDNLPIEQALIKTGIGKLVVLPAGEAVENPVNYLSSNRMKQIVRELKNRYEERYVIFDTPPALPFADAGILAGLVDATLFVVREGRADMEDVQKVLEDFKGRHLLGVVYNDAHTFMKKQDYYYY
jgi:protein-tyrosine kinase